MIVQKFVLLPVTFDCYLYMIFLEYRLRSFISPLIVVVTGFAVPVTEPCQRTNFHPTSGVAVNLTVEPTWYVGVVGFLIILPLPIAEVVTKYSGFSVTLTLVVTVALLS